MVYQPNGSSEITVATKIGHTNFTYIGHTFYQTNQLKVRQAFMFALFTFEAGSTIPNQPPNRQKLLVQALVEGIEFRHRNHAKHRSKVVNNHHTEQCNSTTNHPTRWCSSFKLKRSLTSATGPSQHQIEEVQEQHRQSKQAAALLWRSDQARLSYQTSKAETVRRLSGRA